MHESLTFQEQEQHVANEYMKAAKGHAERSNGTLEVLPYNPVHPYEPQKLDVHHVEGSPIDAEGIKSNATIAYDRFPTLLESLSRAEQQNGTLTLLGESLEAGKNVVINANHGELIDPGVTLAAYYVALRESGYQFRSGIMLGKMLPFLKLRLGEATVPTIDILQIVSDDIYLTMPNTPSREALDIDKHTATSYNARSMQIFEDKLNRGGNLIVAIMTGTTEKPANNNADLIPIEPIKGGAAQKILGDTTIVANTAVWLRGEDPVFEICGIPRSMHSVEEVQSGLNQVIETLNIRVPDKQFVSKAQPTSALGSSALRHLDQQ